MDMFRLAHIKPSSWLAHKTMKRNVYFPTKFMEVEISHLYQI